MGKIPHGKTPEERSSYAEKVRAVAKGYYDNSWRWVSKPNSGANPRLVEVWKKGAVVSIHPSRNCFFVVPGAKTKWHTAATNRGKMATFLSGHDARARRGMPRNPISHPKDATTPRWAREADLIGYTSSQQIVDPSNPLLVAGIQSHPSVYYKKGHVTLDHSRAGNIGWDDKDGWECLFFGNVPSQFL